ncbi:MAG TPA: hypothetical protein VFL58_15280, partial [Gaiellaceae bacterium]|nr:hypothetical protein [Gaiellaceae bacterium]
MTARRGKASGALVLSAMLALAFGLSSGATAAGHAVRAVRIPLGRSERNRLIVAFHTGNPHGLPVLVVGCIHGTECAGIAIAD